MVSSPRPVPSTNSLTVVTYHPVPLSNSAPLYFNVPSRRNNLSRCILPSRSGDVVSPAGNYRLPRRNTTNLPSRLVIKNCTVATYSPLPPTQVASSRPRYTGARRLLFPFIPTKKLKKPIFKFLQLQTNSDTRYVVSFLPEYVLVLMYFFVAVKRRYKI